MEDLSDTQVAEVLSASRLGVLSMAEGGRAYAIPIFFAFDGHDVYFHCHPGAKERFIDKGDEACLVVTHVAGEDIWESVQIFGEISKLTLNTDIDKAKSALYQIPPPPEDGAFPSGKPRRNPDSVFFARLSPSRIHGKASTWKIS